MLKGLVIYQITSDSKLAEALVAGLKQKGMDAKVFPLQNGRPEHESFKMIKAEQADLILTINLAGFTMRNSLELPSYNILSGRMGHLLIKKELLDDPILNNPYNFSMYFYVLSEIEADKLKKNYPELPNVTILKGGKELNSISVPLVTIEQILKDTWLDRELS